jgi:hypothetical protein
MYISPRKQKLYTILAIITLVSIPIGIFGFKFYQDWRIRATSSPTPEDVRISDLTETAVVISWVTPDTSSEGWVKYSTSSTLGGDSQVTQDIRDVNESQTTKRNTHYVSVSNLNPATSYYFVLGSGSQEYKDSEGNAFNFTTAASGSVSAPPSPDPVYGSVTNGEDQSAIIYITMGGEGDRSFPVSTLTNDSGNFEVDLSHVRTSSLSGSYSYSDSTKMNIYAHGADKGGAIVETTVGILSTIEMTMDESVSTTQIFADSSLLNVEDDEADTTETTETTDTTDITDSDEIILTPMGTPILVSSGSEIENVQVTNVTENSFSVIWESDDLETGNIVYGATASSLVEEAIDDRDSLSSKSEYYIHHVTLEDLEPETTYYFKIDSGGIEYDDNGTVYSQTTPATESSPPTSYTIVGVVTGTARADAVVLGQITTQTAESSEISVASDTDGDWVLDLGSVRTSDLESYFDFEITDSIVISGISAGDSDKSTYVISDTEGQVLGVDLNINKSISVISQLPETAIDGIAAVTLTISIMLIIYGLVILGNYYNEEKRYKWEKDFLKELE